MTEKHNLSEQRDSNAHSAKSVIADYLVNYCAIDSMLTCRCSVRRQPEQEDCDGDLTSLM